MRGALLVLLLLLAAPLPATRAENPPPDPDLEILLVALDGTEWNGAYVWGEPLRYDVHVRNNGATVASPVLIRLVVGDVQYNVHDVGALAPGEVYSTAANPEDALNSADVADWWLEPGAHTLQVLAAYAPEEWWEEPRSDGEPENNHVALPFTLVRSAQMDWALYSYATYSSRATHHALRPFFTEYNGPEPHDRAVASGILCKDTYDAVALTAVVEHLDPAGLVPLARGERAYVLPEAWYGCWWFDVPLEGTFAGPYVARMAIGSSSHYPGTRNDAADDEVRGFARHSGTPQPEQLGLPGP